MNRDVPTDPGQQRQALSALMDGDGSAADDALRGWRDDARARADWHAYHLIGELMRSDDVQCAPLHDAQFLSGLRVRLALEPVVLAPAALTRPDASARPGRSSRTWVRSMAVAAGFAAVAGVLVVMRPGGPEGAAQDRSPLLANQGVAPSASAAAPGTEGRLIRSAELDRYLAAHRQYNNTSALAAPGGVLRNAAATAPGR